MDGALVEILEIISMSMLTVKKSSTLVILCATKELSVNVLIPMIGKLASNYFKPKVCSISHAIVFYSE